MIVGIRSIVNIAMNHFAVIVTTEFIVRHVVNHRVPNAICHIIVISAIRFIVKTVDPSYLASAAILPIVTCVNVKTRMITTISSTKNRIFAPVVVELVLNIVDIFDTQNRRRNGREQAMYLTREKGGIFILTFAFRSNGWKCDG